MENHWETWTWLTTVVARLWSLYSCHAHFIVLKHWRICITIKDFSLRKCTVAKKNNWWNFDLTARCCLFSCECYHFSFLCNQETNNSTRSLPYQVEFQLNRSGEFIVCIRTVLTLEISESQLASTEVCSLEVKPIWHTEAHKCGLDDCLCYMCLKIASTVIALYPVFQLLLENWY